MGKAGRPKAEVKREKVVSIRFLQEDYDRLKKYADASNMTVTQVVHKGVDFILDIIEEKNHID